MEAEKEEAPCVAVPSTHPLYVLYTSGTTGEPKGIVHDTGGTAVGLDWCMSNVFNVHPNSVHFACSDIGWVVGHSFIVYGPLLAGATTLMFEGVPTYPHPGRFWEIIDKYKVNQIHNRHYHNYN